MPNSDDGYVIKLEIPSEIKLIYVLDSVISEILRELEFDEEAREQVELAVIEAGTNAIKHGNNNDANKIARFQFELYSDKITIKVKDEGEGFKPGQVDDPLNPDNLLKNSGRGIFLIQMCMDELSFNERGNEISMVKYKTRSITPPDSQNQEGLVRRLASSPYA